MRPLELVDDGLPWSYPLPEHLQRELSVRSPADLARGDLWKGACRVLLGRLEWRQLQGT